MNRIVTDMLIVCHSRVHSMVSASRTVYSVIYSAYSVVHEMCYCILAPNKMFTWNQLWDSRDPFSGFIISLRSLAVSTGRNMNQTFRCLSDLVRLRAVSKRFSHVRSISNTEVIWGLIWGQRSIIAPVSLSYSTEHCPNGAAGTSV